MGTFYVFMGGEVGVNKTEFGKAGWEGGWEAREGGSDLYYQTLTG